MPARPRAPPSHSERGHEDCGDGGRGISGAHRVEGERSEGHVVAGQLPHDATDLAPIGVERPAEPGSVMEHGSGAALDGRIVVRGEIVVEHRMLGEQSKAQGTKCVR